MKVINFDGKEFYEIPGFCGYYVSNGLKVIKDDKCLKRVKYAQQYIYVSVWQRNNKPHVSLHINGKDYAKPVMRLLYMAQKGYTDQTVTLIQNRASFIQLPDGMVKMINTDNVARMNLEKAKEAMRKIKKEVTPAKSLAELRKMERLYALLIENGDPKPILAYLEQVRDETVIPYLIKRKYGSFRSVELANEAMSEMIVSVLKGYLPINVPKYMLAVAKCVHVRHRKALQIQFADLYSRTEYKVMTDYA